MCRRCYYYMAKHNWFGNKPSWASRAEEEWREQTTTNVQETRGCFSYWGCPGVLRGSNCSQVGASKKVGHWWSCKTLSSEDYHYFGINSRKMCSSCCCLCWDTRSSNAVCVCVDGEVEWWCGYNTFPQHHGVLQGSGLPWSTLKIFLYAYGHFYHILICRLCQCKDRNWKQCWSSKYKVSVSVSPCLLILNSTPFNKFYEHDIFNKNNFHVCEFQSKNSSMSQQIKQICQSLAKEESSKRWQIIMSIASLLFLML